MFMLLACANQVELDPPAPPVVPVQAEAEPAVRPPEQPRFTQDALEGLETTVALEGELRCVSPGPFQIRVYPSGQENRLYSSWPSSGFLSSVEIPEAGPFRVLVPQGAQRLVLAWHDSDGDGWPSLEEPPFFADPHGQPWDLEEGRAGLVLDCTVAPTEPPKEVSTKSPEPRLITTVRDIEKEGSIDGREKPLGEKLAGGPQ